MPSILIVDDDPSTRARLVQSGQIAGCSIAEACDGRGALSKLERHPFNAIALRILSPGKDSVEAITELQHHWPHCGVLAVWGGCKLNGAAYAVWVDDSIGDHIALEEPITASQVLHCLGLELMARC